MEEGPNLLVRGYGELVGELVSGDLEGGRQAGRERGDYLELIF